MLARRSRAAIEAPPTPPIAVVAAEDPAQMRDSAAAARAGAEAARARADGLLTEARAEADRLIAQARHDAQQLVREATAADREAARLTSRAAYLDHAEALRGQIAEHEQQVAALTVEKTALREQAGVLDEQIGGLGVQREAVAAHLAAARGAGDVAAVSNLRAEIGAIDEVVSSLRAQQDAANARVAAIGEPDGTGALAATLSNALADRAQLRQVLNALDPDRFEARYDWVAAGLLEALDSALTKPAPTPPRELDHLGPTTSAADQAHLADEKNVAAITALAGIHRR